MGVLNKYNDMENTELQQSFKISEASFDMDKEQFFCHVGMPVKNEIMQVKYTIWGDIMPELAQYYGQDYEHLPQNIQRLWEKGQDKCYEKALKFAKKQIQFAEPTQKSFFQSLKDRFRNTFKTSHEQ